MDLRLKFNEDVCNYDNARPTYSEELLCDIISYSKLDSKCKALEIGIGTGKATLSILKSGCDVTAIELGDKLANYVKDKFHYYGNFEVINDDFMEYSIEEESYDLIYSATAFHWLPLNEALVKVKNTLKNNGSIALFWNHPFPNRKEDESNMASKSVYDKYFKPKKPINEFSEEDCKELVEKLEILGFKDVKSKLYYNTRTLTTDEYIKLLNTYSDHRALPLEIKLNFEKDMRKAIDDVGGKINIYDTMDLYLARK